MADDRHDASLAAIETRLDGYPRPTFRERLRRDLERRITVTTSATAAVLTPYVMTQDIEPLIAFVKEVFGAAEVHRATGSAGGIHCELRIGDTKLFFGGAVPDKPVPPRLIALHVYVDDVDAVYARAIRAGATSMGEPAQMPYNERAGYVRDPAGNHWYIATHTGPTYFSREPPTVTPSLQVRQSPGRSADEFMAFLQAAFGAEIEARHEHDGQLKHAVVRIGGEALELGTSEEYAIPAPAALMLNVADAGAVYAQALAAGATSMYPPAPQKFGGRMAGVTDPWGNEWYLASA